MQMQSQEAERRVQLARLLYSKSLTTIFHIRKYSNMMTHTNSTEGIMAEDPADSMSYSIII